MISPLIAVEIIDYEIEFGCTINRQYDLPALIQTGTAYKSITEELIDLATSYNYDQPVIIPEPEPWILPAGAFGENCGAY